MGIDEVGPTTGFRLTGCRLSVLPLLNVYSSVVATDQRKPNTQKHKCTSFFNMCLCFVCRFAKFMVESGGLAAVVVSEGGGVWIQGGGGVCGGYLHREVANGEARRHVSHTISLHSLVAQLVERSATLQIMGPNPTEGSSSFFHWK